MNQYRFPQKPPPTMVKIKDGVYLSRDDPDFYKKALRYRPDDQNLLYGYARKLASEGKPEALGVFKQAADKGHAPSKGRLIELNNRVAKPLVIAAADTSSKQTSKPDGTGGFWLYILGALMILLASILLIFIILYGKYIYEKTDVHYHYGSSTSLTQDSVSLNHTATESLSSEKLNFSVLYNAIVNYNSATGFFPDSLEDLSGTAPDNWISMIPNGLTYSKRVNGFTVHKNGSEAPLQPTLLELHYYPDDNRLGLVMDNRVLVWYPVASGSEGNAVPFTDSKITNRVVDPNGGKGTLGTRGLELTGGFAIHGTNDDNSIGKRVTLGCLRMHNSDIEALYSYVPLGTPFKVIKGSSEQISLYPDGLPPATNWNLNKERTPQKVYHWKS